MNVATMNEPAPKELSPPEEPEAESTFPEEEEDNSQKQPATAKPITINPDEDGVDGGEGAVDDVGKNVNDSAPDAEEAQQAEKATEEEDEEEGGGDTTAMAATADPWAVADPDPAAGTNNSSADEASADEQPSSDAEEDESPKKDEPAPTKPGRKSLVMSAPASKAFSSKKKTKKPQSTKEEEDPAVAAAEAPVSLSAGDPLFSPYSSGDESEPPSDLEDAAPPAADLPEPETEEDDEIRTAMEMALAAAQNPKMSPAELRKLVAQKNKQVGIVDEVQHQQELQREEARKQRWSQKKEGSMGWWFGAAEKVSESVLELRESAGQAAEEYKDRVDRRRYADQIKDDPQYQDTRRKLKVTEKTLKAHRLQGNRIETRHAFKRQRQEKKLHEMTKKLNKTHTLFVDCGYNVHEYAKAMVKASKKWKKQGSDEELLLEAQLCRNMHQMLAIEKQKSKVKKSSREIKKYLQRCKGWLSDKKALCEMHMMTLDATNSSFVLLYEDTLKQQDDLIAKLMASGEFEGIDLEAIELDNWKQLSERTIPGPSATLSALRGLPINDSIRIKKDQLDRDEDNRKPPPPSAKTGQEQRGELIIETTDDHSAHSDISDPDGDSLQGGGPDSHGESAGSLNSSGSLDFGNDAPWSAAAPPDLDSVEEDTPPPKKSPPKSDSKPAAVVKDGKRTSNRVNGKRTTAVEGQAAAPADATANGQHHSQAVESDTKTPTSPAGEKSARSGKSASTSHSAGASSNLEFSENDSTALAGDAIVGMYEKGSETNPEYFSDASATEKPGSAPDSIASADEEEGGGEGGGS